MSNPLLTVAIADDQPGILEVLSLACESHYEIIGKAKNGLEAVEIVKTMRPNVLVLDIHMPLMDGLTALAQIANLKTTAVVILTADSNPGVARQAMDLGASGYMIKPFELSQVVPMLETAWHRFQTHQALSEELAKMSETLETRKLLDKAKGILMEQQGFTEEEAHKMLQKMSQDQGVTVKELCRSLIQVKMVLGGRNKAANRPKNAA
jgi:AmiR/NasT family two-component response regulator